MDSNLKSKGIFGVVRNIKEQKIKQPKIVDRKTYDSNYNKFNKDRISERKKLYYKNNRDKLLKYSNDYYKTIQDIIKN
jgi:hypothetical protein